MTKHKTEDYKISAVKYYLNNDNGDGYKKTCKIFDCKKSTLRDWIKRYKSPKIPDEYSLLYKVAHETFTLSVYNR